MKPTKAIDNFPRVLHISLAGRNVFI